VDVKSKKNSGAISRLFEPQDRVLCKGRREGLYFSGSLDCDEIVKAHKEKLTDL
jgi:hypothetical protein